MGENLETNFICSYKQVEEKVWQADNRTMLYGGKNDSMHFDITNWSLSKCKLQGGLGREIFQALLEPVYTPINEINNIENSEKCLVLYSDTGTKIYPYVTLRFHEAVNEVVEGNPVVVAYCELADFAVVYNSTICDVDLTFAVSGYTYADENVYDNIRSFILWDRETESLWWPLLDLGVSGAFNNVALDKLDKNKWIIMAWEDIVTQIPDAIVLDFQEQEIPTGNFKIDVNSLECF